MAISAFVVKVPAAESLTGLPQAST